MIGIVLVTNGRLAEELLIALQHVVGKQSNIESISIGSEDDLEARRADILEAVSRTDADNGVIILTDMFGGTPSNLAISCMETGQIEIISRRRVRRSRILMLTRMIILVNPLQRAGNSRGII